MEKGLSQNQLGKIVGISQNAIAKWEKLQRIPNAMAIITLAKFFYVTTDYLLGLTD